MNQKEFNQALLNWHLQNIRVFPWDQTTNPYHIYVSEIILQQTRTTQGLGYYERFINHFPTINSLAESEISEVLLLWQGLGYYSRARNMHACAQKIVQRFGGLFPSNYPDLLSLPGVGPYTAAAIACFAFNEPIAAIDGNLRRLISRLYAKHFDLTQKGKRNIQAIGDILISKKSPDTWNRAMMNLGSQICIGKTPICSKCPVNKFCIANRQEEQNLFPVKKRLKKKITRFFHYLLVTHESSILIRERKGKDIWKGLYELVLCERPTENLITNTIMWGIDGKHTLMPLKREMRVLSHQNIVIFYYCIELSDNNLIPESYLWVPLKEIHKFAFSKSLQVFIQNEVKI